MKKRAFTLIELLIVVAIIAILAAIAVPNFLEAQVRIKVSRVRADMRTFTTALTTYKIDTNKWIMDTWTYNQAYGIVLPTNSKGLWAQLTTPIAYLSSIPTDTFQENHNHDGETGLEVGPTFTYASFGWIDATKQCRDAFAGEWIMTSCGPDRFFHPGSWCFLKAYINNVDSGLYDASNGTVSEGDLALWGP